MNAIILKTTYLLAFLFILYAGIFVYSGALNVDLMEARNFATARDMIEHSSWLRPTMNGEPRIAKPPLPTWLTAYAMIQAGTDTNLYADRIPAGLSALMTVVFTFLFMRSYTGRFSPAFYSGVVLATSYMFMYMARKGTWDIFCHTFMMGAIWTLYEGLKSNRRRWFISAGVMMGLSWMSKGPVSFYTILLPFLVAYPLFHGVKGFFSRWKGLLTAFSIGLLLILAWSAYLFFHLPHLSLQVIHCEIKAWGSRHLKPAWYYIQFPFMAGIWFIPAIAMLIPGHAMKHFKTKKSYFFFISWVIIEMILLTIVPEKKDRYLLPVAITMSMPIACYISSFFDTEIGKAEKGIIKFYKYFTLFCLLASVPLAGYSLFIGGHNLFTEIICGVSALMFIGQMWFKLDKRLGLFILLPVAFSLLICSAAPVAVRYNRPKEFMELIKARDNEELKTDTIYSDNDNMKRVWAIDRKILLFSESEEKFKAGNTYIFMTDKDENPIPADRYTSEPIETGLSDWHFYKFTPVVQ